jgi:uncharacterized membrane protein YbhN (UPF0104 family)
MSGPGPIDQPAAPSLAEPPGPSAGAAALDVTLARYQPAVLEPPPVLAACSQGPPRVLAGAEPDNGPVLTSGPARRLRGRRHEPASGGLVPSAEREPASGRLVPSLERVAADRTKVRSWLRIGLTVVAAAVLGVELVLGWPALAAAFAQFRTPSPGWVAAAVLVEMASMRAYARMQRRLLRSAGIEVSLLRHVALAYAAHSLSVTLPGGPAFSTSFNFQQLRRFGASPAVASWCIALSGILSAGALALVTLLGGIAANGRPNWPALAGYAVLFIAVALAVRFLGPLTRAVDAVVAVVRRRPGTPVADFVAQVRSVRLRPLHLSVAGAYAVANWLLDALCLYLSCLAIGASTITTTQLLIAYCAGMAAASIFPVIPGGLGIIDSALILGLVAGGLTAGTAIAAVVLYRLISLGFIIGTGWVSWLVIRRRAGTGSRDRLSTRAG